MRTNHTMFVAPAAQSRGVGTGLMLAVLTVPSSVTAEKFYTKRGFKAVRESFHGDERTIIMERVLGA